MKLKLLVLFGLMLMLSACGEQDTTYDAFAQCLSDNGATFYGAFYCPHCRDQKAMFGDSVNLLPYVECYPDGNPDVQSDECKSHGVKRYPTWIFADGHKEEGVLSFDELSKYTSCPLPGNESVMVK